MTSTDTAVQAITADEIALYDRQIRLWGVKAQESLRKANVLLISMKALANEVAKNLVLAGINSLTVVDDQVVTKQDLGAQFFVSEADLGKNVSLHKGSIHTYLTSILESRSFYSKHPETQSPRQNHSPNLQHLTTRSDLL
jgi:molybdopterin/thiamine biosynthesis adenylyltransferase